MTIELVSEETQDYKLTREDEESVHLAKLFDSDIKLGGILMLEEGQEGVKDLPAYLVVFQLKSKSEDSKVIECVRLDVGHLLSQLLDQVMTLTEALQMHEAGLKQLTGVLSAANDPDKIH